MVLPDVACTGLRPRLEVLVGPALGSAVDLGSQIEGMATASVVWPGQAAVADQQGSDFWGLQIAEPAAHSRCTEVA